VSIYKNINFENDFVFVLKKDLKSKYSQFDPCMDLCFSESFKAAEFEFACSKDDELFDNYFSFSAVIFA
jgi:hypothetical protein